MQCGAALQEEEEEEVQGALLLQQAAGLQLLALPLQPQSWLQLQLPSQSRLLCGAECWAMS